LLIEMIPFIQPHTQKHVKLIFKLKKDQQTNSKQLK